MNARIYSCLLKELRIFFFFLLFFFPFGVSANNIQIKEPARVISVSGGYATIEVRLAWENSWRDAENWDAAYLFLKYRTGSGSWTHIPVQLAGNIISSPYTYMTATPNQTTAPGLFIYRDNLGAGNPNVVCKIRWKTNFRQEQFDNGEVQLLAQAIEMVFVPAGPYVLGDSLSANCFADSYGKPITVRTESSNIGLGYVQEGGVYQNVTVSASYPKGFQGFYMMKYELSQEQYVNFLNTLTLAQQKALLPNWSSLKEGDYIFGDAKGRSCRNGIILAYHTDPAAPMVFANNFNKDDEYNGAGDGQTIASNYMSIYDLLAYSSWSGLRPMSEMEFEKACRLPYPSLEKRGYAWNKGDGTIARAMNLSGEGFESENVGVGNVNFKNTFEGPLRCGIFAKSGNSTAQASGSTYWGGMEMSGNVRELCRNVNDWYFYWNRHGEGAYNPGLWSASLSYYGVRGGGFTSDAEELQVSDRSLREYFKEKSATFRDSTVGFRMVRTLELGAVDLNPGTITALTTICPNVTLTIQSTAGASVRGMNNIPVRYEWYLNSVKLEGQTADTLVYSDWKPGTYYNFERKAICVLGEKSTNTVRVYVTSPALNAGTITGGTRCAPGFFKIGSKAPANITCGYPITYSWYINDVLVKDSVGETLSKEWEAGTYRVVRRASAFGLSRDAVATLTVTAVNLKAGQIYGGMVMETVETTITNVKSASVGCGNFKYSWYIDSVLVAGASGAQLTHAFDAAGFYQVIRRATADNGDVADAMDTVIVNSKTAICGKSNGTVVDDEENVYTVLPMADNRCWMTQNMRRRNINHRHVGNGAAVDNDETNKRLHDGVQTNDKVYGVHYTWNVAMQGATYQKAQGICPAGWYVPTDEEWRTLEMAYGMTYAQATTDGAWRGSNQGTQFKVNGTSKFNATLSGYSATSNVNTVGYYWTSTRHTSSTSYAFYRYFHKSNETIYRYRLGLGTFASLRCIRSMCLGTDKPENLKPGSIKGGTAGVNFPYTIKTGGTATVSCGGLIYSWYINGVRVPGQGASLTHVFTTQGTYTVVRRATADNDKYAETSAVVRVFPACGSKDYVLDDQANRYSIKEMGDGRCWMTQNMRRRDINHRHAGNGAAVDNDGTNKRLHDGVQANDVAYGAHYIWSIAMQGSTAEKAQGICPAGWYVPTDLEWRQLEMAYGMTATQANTDGAWRGYDEGTRLKSGGNSGFNATLSGYDATSNINTVGYYWTSTRHTSSTSYAFYRYFHKSNATIYRYRLGLGTYASLRCIRSMCYDNSPKDVNAGTIQGGTSSVGFPIVIKGTKTATVSCGGLDYTWYVNGTLVSGAEAASLTYTFNKAGVFNVTRRATADNGLYAEVTAKVIVYAPCGHLDYVNDQLGNRYNIKEMADGRCWMIQNMRRTDINHRHAGNGAAVDNDGTNKRLHDGVQTNDVNHGAQYIWSVAMGGSASEKARGICPPGWYVPTDLEWRQLEMAYGMTSAQANVDGSWRGYNEGTRLKSGGNSGFNATLSGYDATSNVNTVGYYWTSTRHTSSTSYAFYRYFHKSNATIYRYRLGLGTFASLRCIRSRCENGQEPASLNAGKITGGSCAVNYKFTIKNAQEATISCGGLYYSWYVNDVLVTGQVAQALAYTFTKPGVYKVVRRTTADNGDFADATATVTVYSACSGLSTVIDEQGKEYSIKEMADNRCWMTQNLRRTDVSHRHAGNGAGADTDGTNLYTHEGEQVNDKAYGVHYVWSVAMQGSTTEKAKGLCPIGWYVPTDLEWRQLEMAYGMTSSQANVDGSWRGYNEGTRLKSGGNSGFNATLSGYDATSNVSTVGYYWTSTRHTSSTSYAFYRHFHKSNATIYRYRLGLGTYASLRCIKATCYDAKPTISTAGSISGGSTAVNYAIKIKSTGAAAVSCGGLVYSWYVDGSLLANQRAATLTWTPKYAGTYEIVRRASVDTDPATYKETKTTVIAYSPCSGLSTVIDDQGNSYNIKEMADNRCWMIQNIRRRDVNHRHVGNGAAVDNDATNKHLHDGVQTNDVNHGAQYTWSVAMGGSASEKARGLCPPGWYVPTDLEWRQLEMAYGMTSSQANVDGSWRGYNQGTRLKAAGNSGFNATLSGYDATSNVNTVGYYWTSTRHTSSTSYAFYRYFHKSNATIYRYRLGLGTFASLRCIKTTCYGAKPIISTAGAIGGGYIGVNYAITIKNTGAPTVSCGGLVYSWYIDGVLIANQRAATLTWTPTKVGTYEIVRRVTLDDDPTNYKEAKTTVTAYSPCAGKTYVDDEQGNRYSIKEMADDRCWMTQNLRRTDVSHRHAGNGAAADTDGTNLYLHEGAQGNDKTHGVHYTWSVAMGGSTAEKVKGLCPPGWYVPSDLEWRQLEMAYGMTSAQANVDGSWRGYNEGTRLKSGGNSGFNATLSGYDATSNVSTVGYYWTSTRHTSSTSYAFYRYFHKSNATIYRYRLGLGTYASLRCIRSMCYAGTTSAITSAGSITGGKVGVNYPFKIKNSGAATVNCGGVEYSWYVDGKLISGQVAASLTYTFTKAGGYTIKRRATADNGTYSEALATVTVVTPCQGVSTVTDEQGNVYTIKEMADTRCWMTQNIRRTNVVHRHVGNGGAAAADGKSTHEGAQTNDKTHGVHYTWSVAMQGSTGEKAKGLCPVGWHVPTDLEWRQLEMAYGMTSAQANVDGSWRGYNQGTRLKSGGNSGFNATLSGYDATSNVNTVGYYWTSTRHTSSTSYAFYRYFHKSNTTVYRYRLSVGTYASLRCIKNE